MDIVNLLEQLASNSNHLENEKLIATLPKNIKDAFSNNNFESLKLLISENNSFANEIDVIQINL